ncbi:MAG: gliding motility protein GldL [Bacteroidota bacterium]|nr:gliding motility protein GldL [Bacteroidota bacterium]
MGLAELTAGKAWKSFMAKVYGWGASVTIIGALFKIQHWPGAGIMLTIGLCTEAVIFFFSAFEPPHSEPDWTLVYPELAGMEDEESMSKIEKNNKNGSSSSLTGELDKMLEDAKIGPELIQSLGLGLKNLSDSTKEISKISVGVVPMDEYVKTMEVASKSMSNLSGSTEKYAGSINVANETINNLSGAYNKTAENLKADLNSTKAYSESINAATQSVNLLKDTYIKSTESLTKSAEAINFSSIDGKSYGEQIQKISKNLAALNVVYELQLKDVKEQVAFTEKVSDGINVFLNNLTGTVEDTTKFKDNITKLNKNISALNTVYGNMLTAMNVKINA